LIDKKKKKWGVAGRDVYYLLTFGTEAVFRKII
jgi:hypothetical protein